MKLSPVQRDLLLEVLYPRRYQTPSEIKARVNALWEKRGYKTKVLQRPRTITRRQFAISIMALEHYKYVEWRARKNAAHKVVAGKEIDTWEFRLSPTGSEEKKRLQQP
jgi:hypothetical protein